MTHTSNNSDNLFNLDNALMTKLKEGEIAHIAAMSRLPAKKITVNKDELVRIRDLVDAHISESVEIWKRIDNLIKQGDEV
jgi:hypothetical protein